MSYRVTEFIGYSGQTSSPNEQPRWGYFTASFMDDVQSRFEEWLAAHDAEVRAGVQGDAKLLQNSGGVVTEEAFPYLVVNYAGRPRARFEDEEHALEFARTLVGGRVIDNPGDR